MNFLIGVISLIRLNENFRILEKNYALMVEAHEKILKSLKKKKLKRNG